jgi:hypothetical protein
MSSTFRDLLHVNNDTIDRPQALADGHYIGEIKGHEFGLSRQKQTPYVRITLTPSEATSDVPEGANVKKNGEPIDITKLELRKDFYVTPNAVYRLGDMLNAVLGTDGRFYDERLPETRGVRVMFAVTHRDSDDGTQTFNDVGTIVKA